MDFEDPNRGQWGRVGYLRHGPEPSPPDADRWPLQALAGRRGLLECRVARRVAVVFVHHDHAIGVRVREVRQTVVPHAFAVLAGLRDVSCRLLRHLLAARLQAAALFDGLRVRRVLGWGY